MATRRSVARATGPESGGISSARPAHDSGTSMPGPTSNSAAWSGGGGWPPAGVASMPRPSSTALSTGSGRKPAPRRTGKAEAVFTGGVVSPRLVLEMDQAQAFEGEHGLDGVDGGGQARHQ